MSFFHRQNLQSLDFDKEKRPQRKAKNKVTPDETAVPRRSTLSVRLFLKEFCVEFLVSAYNHIMNIVKVCARICCIFLTYIQIIYYLFIEDATLFTGTILTILQHVTAALYVKLN